MKYTEAREQLIQTWGRLSEHWGISRTMGQVHALLMVTSEPLTTDQIINELDISRGSASQSLRSLLEWGIVHKTILPGERKEYYTSEKDVWKMALQIARERKRRELDPVIHSMQHLQEIDPDSASPKEVEELNKMTSQILDVAMQVDKMLDIGIRTGGQSFVRKLINVLR